MQHIPYSEPPIIAKLRGEEWTLHAKSSSIFFIFVHLMYNVILCRVNLIVFDFTCYILFTTKGRMCRKCWGELFLKNVPNMNQNTFKTKITSAMKSVSVPNVG